MHCLADANWTKLNEDEFTLLAHATLTPEAARSFLTQHRLQGLVITRGAKGAFAVVEGQAPIEVAPTPALQVVDTVGAGDAFSAVLLLGLNCAWPLNETLKRAQVFASALVGCRGATVKEPGFYQAFIEAWNL